MKIENQPGTVVISEVFPPSVGGSGKWLWDIYSRQAPNRYSIFCGHHPKSQSVDSKYPQEIIRCDIEMQNRSLANRSSLFAYLSQIKFFWRQVKKRKPKAIHASRPLHEGLVGAIVSKLTRVPLLLYVHGEDINVAKTSRELKLLTKFVLNTAQLIVANSSYTHSLLANEWSVNSKKINLMHPGIDCQRFGSSSKTVEKKADRQLRLFTAGRLQKRKGHDIVIKAIPRLISEFRKIDYFIAGAGDEFESLQRLTKELEVTESVHFLGEISDEELLDQYQSCDIFILANREIDGDVEGFGIVLLEAQASGKPVIAGASGGTADTLLDGITGFLINANDEANLIDTIIRNLACSDDRIRIGTRGRQHVTENFDWEKLSDQAREIFSVL